MDRAGRSDIDVAGAELAGFAVDCHHDHSLDDGAPLLMRMVVQGNLGAWFDSHKVDHHPGAGCGPHGDTGNGFRLGIDSMFSQIVGCEISSFVISIFLGLRLDVAGANCR